jgi:phage FluMu gp28-like protein
MTAARPAILPLYPYQRRWVEDRSQLKVMVW